MSIVVISGSDIAYATAFAGRHDRTWQIVTTKARLESVERTWPDGKVEQFIVTKAE